MGLMHVHNRSLQSAPSPHAPQAIPTATCLFLVNPGQRTPPLSTALLLCYHRLHSPTSHASPGEASAYLPYVRVMPASADSLVTWAPEELELLQGGCRVGAGWVQGGCRVGVSFSYHTHQLNGFYLLHPYMGFSCWHFRHLPCHTLAPPCPADAGTSIQHAGRTLQQVYEKEVAPRTQGRPDVWPPGSCGFESFQAAADLVQSRAFHMLAENWVTGSKQVTELDLVAAACRKYLCCT